MGLNHDFVLLDRAIDGEWSALKFIHDPRAIHLHDDLIRYMLDTLMWIPTYNPPRKLAGHGLNLYGVTLIEREGAGIAEQVFRGWAGLFAIGPQVLDLNGGYSWIEGEPESGRMERLRYCRDEVIEVLQTLAGYAADVARADGGLYLYHGGI